MYFSYLRFLIYALPTLSAFTTDIYLKKSIQSKYFKKLFLSKYFRDNFYSLHVWRDTLVDTYQGESYVEVLEIEKKIIYDILGRGFSQVIQNKNSVEIFHKEISNLLFQASIQEGILTENFTENVILNFFFMEIFHWSQFGTHFH
jgi:hypothetical protein